MATALPARGNRQLEQMPKRSPEPQKQQEQHAADAQAMETWERDTQTELNIEAPGERR